MNVKLNMEMSIAKEIVEIASRLEPDQCTLVPERREELTTEGGLDVVRLRRRIGPVVKRLKKKGIELSAFIEPVPDQLRASADLGFDAVELWTGGYAHAKTPRSVKAALKKLDASIEVGHGVGLNSRTNLGG